MVWGQCCLEEGSVCKWSVRRGRIKLNTPVARQMHFLLFPVWLPEAPIHMPAPLPSDRETGAGRLYLESYSG